MSKKRANKKIREDLKLLKIKFPKFLLKILIPILFLFLFTSYLILNISKTPPNSQPQQMPTKPKIKSIFPKAEIIEHVSREKKEIALTFDADMTYGMINQLKKGTVKSWHNKSLIDYLKQEKIEATIFLTGLWTKQYPKEAKEIAQNPLFEIGNHSNSHPAFKLPCFGLPNILESKKIDEIEKAQETIVQITGITPKIFRFPGGCYKTSDLQIISDLGMKAIQWDVAGGDSFNRNTNSIVYKVEKNTKNGSIIVLHLNYGPNAPKTYDAIIQIIPYLKKQGFKFVKVSELISN